MTSPSAVIARVRDALRVIEEGDRPLDATLSKALDELAMAYHDCPPGSLADSDGERPSRDDYPILYAALGARFADYGYYSAADPLKVPDDASGIMDAIDDLADIVLELREILWHCDRFGADDAHWHYRQNFEIHLGTHIRSLSGYLHARQFGWP